MKMELPKTSDTELFRADVRRKAWWNNLLVVTNRDTQSLSVINDKNEVLFRADGASYYSVADWLNQTI